MGPRKVIDRGESYVGTVTNVFKNNGKDSVRARSGASVLHSELVNDFLQGEKPGITGVSGERVRARGSTVSNV